MTGPKLNERSFVAGERSGTKASALYVRTSASKVRVVLNLIRGLPVRQADEVLQFTDRDAAATVRKVLASAVANAVHNDEQDADELFVKACFADEGPTLKRFTPRARGRAGRIKKRTSHITIVVARLDDARLEVVQAREARRSAAGRRRGAGAATGATASRRARVERSRQRAAGLRAGAATAGDPAEQPAGEQLVEADIAETPVDQLQDLTTTDVETETIEAVDAPEATTADSDANETDTTGAAGGEGSASDEPQSSAVESEADDEEDN